MKKKEFMYVSTFTDRSGFVRNYFRHPWVNKRIPLPGAIGSREFVAAYSEALALATANKQSQAPDALSPKVTSEYFQIPESGVYILIKGGCVSYIGTSKDMRQRVIDHRRSGRQFDKAFYISASNDDRIELESALLRSLQTAENRAIGGIVKSRPKKLTRDEVRDRQRQTEVSAKPNG